MARPGRMGEALECMAAAGDVPAIDFQKQMIMVFTADGPDGAGSRRHWTTRGTSRYKAMSTMMGGAGLHSAVAGVRGAATGSRQSGNWA